MKIAVLTSNSKRHYFVANYLAKKHDVCIVVSEEKGNEQQYVGANEEESRILREHFKSLRGAENRYFSDNDFANIPKVLCCRRGEVNAGHIYEQVTQSGADYIVVFGCGLINDKFLDKYHNKIIGVHQGLSPYYRGSATNFWPFVNSELQYVGVTIHYVDKGIDTGRIICHGRPHIKPGDTMHDIGCKTIVLSAELLTCVLSMLNSGKQIPGISQWLSGKLYQRKDFNAQAVIKANENMRNGLVEQYLKEGETKPLKLIQMDNQKTCS